MTRTEDQAELALAAICEQCEREAADDRSAAGEQCWPQRLAEQPHRSESGDHRHRELHHCGPVRAKRGHCRVPERIAEA